MFICFCFYLLVYMLQNRVSQFRESDNSYGVLKRLVRHLSPCLNTTMEVPIKHTKTKCVYNTSQIFLYIFSEFISVTPTQNYDHYIEFN